MLSTFDVISEDINILQGNRKYPRLYDCGLHAEPVLEVIQKEGLDLKVMLGADLDAEVSNPAGLRHSMVVASSPGTRRRRYRRSTITSWPNGPGKTGY